MHRNALLLTASLLLLTCAVFALAPWLDLAAARIFINESHAFIGVTPIGEAFRTIGFHLPIWIMGLAFAGWLLRLAGMRTSALPSGRAVLFLGLSLALGPGLLVNTILKDHSHRPRPVQTQDFGGSWEFRPWYRFDGQCKRNCSFVSGEAASAFWTLAPALLTPPPIQPVAIAAALTFGTAVAGLRMAFGGHYLSDSLISALLTILLVLTLHRFFYGRRRSGIRARDDKNHDRDLRGAKAPL